MRAAHYVCLTSELEMGCMVPCSRMGEVKEEEEEARLAAEGIKESESGERKEGSKLMFQVCLLLPAQSSRKLLRQRHRIRI